MSNIYDIFIKTKESSLPVATLTIGLPEQQDLQEQEKEEEQIKEMNDNDKILELVSQSDNQTMILDLKTMIYDRALP